MANYIPTWEDATNFQLADNITKLLGNHSLKAGFQFNRLYTDFWQPSTPQGTFTFSGTFTEVPNTTGGNTGLAQLLLTPIASSVPGGFNNVGGPNAVNDANLANPVPALTWWTYAGYVEDTWKVNQKLTVNLGLRYDFTKHGIVPGGYNSNFLYYPTPQIVMTKSQCNKNLSPTYLAQIAKDGIAINCAGSDSLVGSTPTNIAPRVGIAYRLHPKLVVRTGFGLFFGVDQPSDILRNTTLNYPYSYAVNYTNNDPGHYCPANPQCIDGN